MTTAMSPTRGVGAALQPPVTYLPCRLDAAGELQEVMMAELEDGRIALMGYTALDRFVAACGSGHPWVLWKTEELERLRELKHFDVAYLDIPMPTALRIETEDPEATDAPGAPR